MTLPAGRAHDEHVCPIHVAGDQEPDDHRVYVNGVSLMHAGGRIGCPGCPDFAVTGSGTVKVGARLAARASDRSLHGGAIIRGSSNVNIGGPTVGAPLGAAPKAKNICEAISMSRATPPDDPRSAARWQQSYGNCNVETTRLLLAMHGQRYSEKTLLDDAIQHGWANGSSDEERRGGGTAKDRQAILHEYGGVESSLEDNTIGNVNTFVAQGRGVIAPVDAGVIWDDPKYLGGSHVVTVVGIENDEAGNVSSYIVVDTGAGPGLNSDNNCCSHISPARMKRALRPNAPLNVTRDPIWQQHVPTPGPVL